MQNRQEFLKKKKKVVLVENTDESETKAIKELLERRRDVSIILS